MKTKIVLLVSFIIFIMTACFNTPDDWDKALLKITFEQKGFEDISSEIQGELMYEVEIKDINGLPIAPASTIEAVTTIQERLEIGDYIIYVTAFDSLGEKMYAQEMKEVHVKAGRNNDTITIDFSAKRVAVATPVANPLSGEVTIGTEVALSAIPQDAEIWYTTDGSTPVPNVSTKYTDTNKITINAATTIRAIAIKTGMTNSNILTAAYTILSAAKPTANLSAGTVPYGTEIILNTTTSGAEIYYTLNGTEPTTSSPKYPDVPIILNYPLNTIVTLKAIAVKSDMKQSETFTVKYTVIPAGIVTTAASPSAGGVTIGTKVALSAIPQDAEIWYTTDGSTPVPNVSTKYTDTNKITINAAMTIRAIAVKTGMTDSSILVAAYTILSVDTPTANRPAGLIVTSMVTPKIILSTATVGAEIWYTTDGSTPVPNSVGTKYYTTSFPITANTTIKAIAVKDGMIDSGILEVAYTTILDIPMVSISAGTFTMGSPTSELDRFPDETQHQVTLTAGFYIGKYQVTQEQYTAVMGTNPSNFSSGPAAGETQAKRPVESVSWYDALVFCNKLSVMEGLTSAYSINGSTDPTDWGTVPINSNAIWDAVEIVPDSTGYRLPTEAQWEYACRAGTTTAYNTGDTIDNNITGWYNANSGSMTHEVGKKPANVWGLYDMHGNVYEWCWDWFGTYPSTAQTDPTGAVSGSNRVLRGGNWNNNAWSLRSASRFSVAPDYGYYGVGLRVVRP